jgi:hypothetical protein
LSFFPARKQCPRSDWCRRKKWKIVKEYWTLNSVTALIAPTWVFGVAKCRKYLRKWMEENVQFKLSYKSLTWFRMPEKNQTEISTNKSRCRAGEWLLNQWNIQPDKTLSISWEKFFSKAKCCRMNGQKKMIWKGKYEQWDWKIYIFKIRLKKIISSQTWEVQPSS